MMQNCGFVVVRTPPFVGEFHGDQPCLVCAPQWGNVSYCGVDRDPWWDFEECFYDGKLNETQRALRQAINRAIFRSFSPGVLFDLKCAEEVLKISNSRRDVNEIILISSNVAYTGDFEILGFDHYVDGYGSLVRLGLFTRQAIFSDFQHQINASGLFGSKEDLSSYLEAYVYRCRAGNLEPPPEGGIQSTFLVARPRKKEGA